MVPAIAALAMLASTQQASAANVCSSSLVHILFDDGQNQCITFTGSSPTASTAFQTGNAATIFGGASMGIRIGNFAGYAQIGGNALFPNATTYSAAATGEIFDAITPSGGGAPGTHYTLVVPFHVTGSYRGILTLSFMASSRRSA